MMAGDVMGQLGDMRNSMEDNVTQNFLVPITDVQVRPTGNQMQTLDAPFIIRLQFLSEFYQFSQQRYLNPPSCFRRRTWRRWRTCGVRWRATNWITTARSDTAPRAPTWSMQSGSSQILIRYRGGLGGEFNNSELLCSQPSSR